MWIRPVNAPISDTFLGHTRRNPPSTEPGVDYACGYGTPVVAPSDGYVHSLKTTNSGAMGRFTMVRLGPHWMRFLHGSRVPVYAGQKFRQGETLLISGASAWGKDWGVGSHVHVTLWKDYGDRVPRPGIDMPYDFEAFLREVNSQPASTGNTRPVPTKEEENEMPWVLICYGRDYYWVTGNRATVLGAGSNWRENNPGIFVVEAKDGWAVDQFKAQYTGIK